MDENTKPSRTPWKKIAQEMIEQNIALAQQIEDLRFKLKLTKWRSERVEKERTKAYVDSILRLRGE